MSNDLQLFNFDGASVRVVIRDGEPWFSAKDVAQLLGYANPQKAVRDHCKAATPIGVNESFTLGPQAVIIPERDVYRLIMRSKLPAAERFEEFVVGEVLPSIRKNGSYQAPAQPVALPSYSEALRQLADQLEQNERITAERDHAIATKALIGSKREATAMATAMATASAAKREASRLSQELGRGAQHATIAAVEKTIGKDFGYQGYRPLKKWCADMGVTPCKVHCPRFGHVKSWPAEAWMYVYGIDLSELFGAEVQA